MNFDDAILRGLKNEDMIVVFNERGKVRAQLEICWGTKPGVVLMEEGWWNQEGGSVDNLSLDRLTDMGYGTAYHDCLVEVIKDV